MSDSKMIDEGGFAFPSQPDADTCGMSLRDWFAGQAITGVIRQCATDLDYKPDITATDYFAQKAYEIADAMIAARKACAV